MDIIDLGWFKEKLIQLLRTQVHIKQLLLKEFKAMSTIPQLIQDAIREENLEGQRREDLITELTAANNSKDAIIASLKADMDKLVALGSADAAQIMELNAQVQQLQENAVDVDAVVSAIKGINNTPVADAAVNLVIEEESIETPQVVADAPEVSPVVVQKPEVVEAALEALSTFEEAPLEDTEE